MKYSKQFLLFILAGGFAAFINIVSRVILSLFLGFKISILIAYLFGMIVAFLLTKNFVFSTQQLNNTKAFLSFSLVNLFAVMQTYLISLYLQNLLQYRLSEISIINLIAHSIGVIVPVFTSFIGHKYLSFGKSSIRKIN